VLGFVLLVALSLTLLGNLPKWPRSRDWGYSPGGGVNLILLILLILFLMVRL
jgi:hypothetical protein